MKRSSEQVAAASDDKMEGLIAVNYVTHGEMLDYKRKEGRNYFLQHRPCGCAAPRSRPRSYCSGR